MDMVLDFGFLKEEMINVIDRDCDHGLILWSHDPLLEQLAQADSLDADLKHLQSQVEQAGYALSQWSGGKLYLMDTVPTAEALARHWFLRLKEPVRRRSEGLAQLYRISVWETPNCRAEFPVFDNDDGGL